MLSPPRAYAAFGRRRFSGVSSSLGANPGRDGRKLPEKMKKSLHSMEGYGTIIKRDCTRYAKKWKVATL